MNEIHEQLARIEQKIDLLLEPIIGPSAVTDTAEAAPDDLLIGRNARNGSDDQESIRKAAIARMNAIERDTIGKMSLERWQKILKENPSSANGKSLARLIQLVPALAELLGMPGSLGVRSR